MKKTIGRVGTLLLSFSFLFSVGCKKKKELKSRIVLETDPYYSCEEFPLSFPTPAGKEIEDRWAYLKKAFSSCVAVAVQERYAVPSEVKERWNHFTYDPQNVEEYKKILDEQSSYERDGLVVFGPDGTFLKFTEVSSGSRFVCLAEDLSGNPKALLTPYEEGAYMYTSSILYDISPEGELINAITLDRPLYVDTDILFLDDGSFLCYDRSTLLLYASDGTLLNEENFGFGSEISRLFRNGGKYYAYFLFEDIYDITVPPTTYMYEIDPASGKKKGDKRDVSCPIHASLLLQGPDGLYSILGNGIRSYDLLSEKGTKEILSWKDADVNYSGISAVDASIRSQDDMYMIRRDYDSNGRSTFCLLHLHRQEKNPHAGKTLIYLAYVGNLESVFIDRINQYNQQPGNTSRIVVTDYSGDDLFSTNGSDSASSWWTMELLSTEQASRIADEVYLEILGGDGPDILMNFGAFSQFNTERALVDLNTLIDGNVPLDRSLFFDNILRANEKDGKLYQIPLNYIITGMVANPEYVGERTGWTYDEFHSIEKALPSGVKMLGNLTQDELLEMLMDGATGNLVDYNRQTVNFDDPEFREILNMVKNYGIPKTKKEIYIAMMNEEMQMDELMFDAGSLVAMSRNVFNLETFANLYVLHNGDVCFIGYPSLNGTGARADTFSSMAISQASQHKEEAWNFIRSLFGEDEQLALATGGFPVNRNAFDAYLDQDMEWDRKEWERAETDPDLARIMAMEQVPIEEKHVRALREVVENIRESKASDPTVMMIINEEAPGYYTDTRTLDDVIAIIEKRSRAVVQERG